MARIVSQLTNQFFYSLVSHSSIALFGLMVLALVGCSGGGDGEDGGIVVEENNDILSAPQDLTATAGDEEVALSWTAVNGATEYCVYVNESAGINPDTGASYDSFNCGIATTGHTVTSLTNDTAYYFVVTASVGSVESAASNEATATPDNTHSFDASLTYTVTDISSTRRFTTNLDGSERAELELVAQPSGVSQRFSPDKNHFAYVKNNRLFVTHTNTNSPVEVSHFQHGGGSIRQFVWSPDNQYLAYLGDADTLDQFEAYVVNIDGSSHTKISRDDSSEYVLGELTFSPDSNWIIYRSIISGLSEGYVTRIDGTENRRFTGSISSLSTTLDQFTWSPDGRYIAYRVTDIASNTRGINTHDTTIGGTNSVRITHDLSATPVADSRIERFTWSPNSNLIAYSVRFVQPSPDPRVRRLFTARPGISASSAETINGPMGTTTEVGEWSWAPDGNFIAYEVLSVISGTNPPIWQAEGINTYDVIMGGNGNSNSTRVTDTTGGPSGAGTKSIDDMTWISDSQFILYRSRIEKLNTIELYRSTPGVTGSSVLLSLDEGVSHTDDVGSFAIAPDGLQVAYAQRLNAAGATYEIYLTDVTTPGIDMLLSSTPVATGQLSPPSISWSSQSTHIAFSTDATTPGKIELYVAPNSGSGSTRVSGSIGASADVVSFEFID